VLRDRERRFVLLGAGVAAALLVLTFVIFPAVSRLNSLARASAAAEKDLAEVRKARPELERIQQDTVRRAGAVRAAANRKESPVVRISNTLQDAGIPQSAFSVKSGGTRDGEAFREESFDVRLENLTYLEAVRALQKLSGADQPTVVRSALLKSRYDDARYVDVTLRVGYLSPKK
jgi:general secretion pathway protein M